MVRIVIAVLFSAILFRFFNRQLSKSISKKLAPIGALALTAISLLPMGWVLSFLGLFLIPRLLKKKSKKQSKICAKCGTLVSIGDTKCHQCGNLLK